MKKYIVFMLLLIVPVFAMQLATEPKLKVELAKYDPYPAKPDEVVTIWIKAENIGVLPIKNASFELIDDFPIHVIGRSLKNYGRIRANDDVVLEYKIKIDKNAPNGTNEIKFKYQLESSSVWIEKKFNITIDTKADYIELEPMFVSLEPIGYPGGKSTLTIDIANIGPGTAYYTVVEANTPIAKIERNKIFVGTLEPDDFDSVEFELMFKDVPPGRYPVNITMRYKDDDYEEQIGNGMVYIELVDRKEALKELNKTPIWYYIIFIIVILFVLRYLIIFLRRKASK